MSEPRASRPHMPGYGIVAADEGSGLMPWAQAEKALATSRNYWVATITPPRIEHAAGASGRPHLMPVWGVWNGRVLWFSSSVRSRKIRNIELNPQCTIATEDAQNPVVVSGPAHIVVDRAETLAFLDAMNAKYDTEYGPDFVNPTVNATVRVRPEWAFSLLEEDFVGSPTRWTL
jgi:pyridoxamine 5'-phosphate oxidase-like protein